MIDMDLLLSQAINKPFRFCPIYSETMNLNEDRSEQIQTQKQNVPLCHVFQSL